MNATMKTCSIEDCCNTALTRGLCKAHYTRLCRHGDPLAGRRSPAARGEPLRYISEVVLKYQGDDCLVWPFSKDGKGYGQAFIDGRTTKVHRYICALVNGESPTPKHEAAHGCGKGHLGCVNPQHLIWKTRAENQADRLLHGTHNRGERCASSKLTESQVREILALKGVKKQREIAAEFGVSRERVCDIHNRRSWGWLGEDNATKGCSL